jgi:hypothetical protein
VSWVPIGGATLEVLTVDPAVFNEPTLVLLLVPATSILIVTAARIDLWWRRRPALERAAFRQASRPSVWLHRLAWFGWAVLATVLLAVPLYELTGQGTGPEGWWPVSVDWRSWALAVAVWTVPHVLLAPERRRRAPEVTAPQAPEPRQPAA